MKTIRFYVLCLLLCTELHAQSDTTRPDAVRADTVKRATVHIKKGRTKIPAVRHDMIYIHDTTYVNAPAGKTIPLIATLDAADVWEIRRLNDEIRFLRTANTIFNGILLGLLLLSIAGLLLQVRIFRRISALKIRANEPPLVSPSPLISPAKAGFICDMMMTAGPRKKFMDEAGADKDLGEDVCGWVGHTDRIGVWLLDGTSDQHCLKMSATGKEYFSSRLLAQNMAEGLRGAMAARAAGELSLVQVVEKVIASVKAEWLQNIHALPADDLALLKDNLSRKNYPICSTTLLVADLTLEGVLTACRAGDSKMLFFRQAGDQINAGEENNTSRLMPVASSLTSKSPGTDDRLFFRIVTSEQGQPDIVCNKPAFEVVNDSAINTLIAFSDGVSGDTGRELEESYAQSPALARRKIMTDVQGTADDKSICFVSIYNH